MQHKGLGRTEIPSWLAEIEPVPKCPGLGMAIAGIPTS